LPEGASDIVTNNYYIQLGGMYNAETYSRLWSNEIEIEGIFNTKVYLESCSRLARNATNSKYMVVVEYIKIST
jgi:hypothetical protein